MSRRAIPCVVVFVAASLAACGNDGPGGSGPDAAPEADAGPRIDAIDNGARYFEHPLFDNPDDCPDDPIYNCYPSLELCLDGRAWMTVTDIINVGSYTESETTIATRWNAGDVPQFVDFEVQEDGSLVDDWQGWTWTPAEPGFSVCGP